MALFNFLTSDDAGINLAPLPVRILAGICSPFERGQKMTAPFAVFLCHLFSPIPHRAYTIMAVCIGQSLKRLAAPRCGTANLIQPVAQYFAVLRGGLSSLTRINRMNNYTPRANHAQKTKKNPIFSIFWHRQLLANGVSFALALRFKRRFPACVLKFQAWEVANG